ncbi:hypothetical protein [Antribacter gilvus]|uniref:hypothetical protein n=1 Tax=Antribacter gilvus TaxID=2304675 RepID=UPI000F792D9F|nr:hypothetical protein [Antribacter gilvus]
MRTRILTASLVGAALALTAACASPVEGPGGTPGASPSGAPGSNAPGTSAPASEPAVSEPGASPAAPGGTMPVEDGYQPSWFEGTAWSCGMPETELVPAEKEYRLVVAGAVTDVVNGEPSHTTDRFLPVRLEGPAGAVWVSPPETVWTQDGVVVHLPALADSGPVEVEPGGELAGVLRPLSHCLPGPETGGMTTYETPMAAGEYQVRAFVEVQPASSPRRFLLSEPVAVVVTADGVSES